MRGWFSTPPRLETSTNVFSAAPPLLLRSFRQGWAIGAAATCRCSGLGGRHDVKFGVDISRLEAPVEATCPGDHQLNFFQGAPLEK